MADPALYRHIVDVLLAEHEKNEPPSPRDEPTAGRLAVTWGIYCQVHRFARAEHTVVLHWIIERGDDGVDAMLTNQSKQMKSWLHNAKDTLLTVPDTIADEITGSFALIDEAKAVKMFRDICGQG